MRTEAAIADGTTLVTSSKGNRLEVYVRRGEEWRRQPWLPHGEYVRRELLVRDEGVWMKNSLGKFGLGRKEICFLPPHVWLWLYVRISQDGIPPHVISV